MSESPHPLPPSAATTGERTEVQRIAGIARAREKRIAYLLGALRYIADAGCDVEAAGRPRCAMPTGDPEEDPPLAPCHACYARYVLNSERP